MNTIHVKHNNKNISTYLELENLKVTTYRKTTYYYWRTSRKYKITTKDNLQLNQYRVY